MSLYRTNRGIACYCSLWLLLLLPIITDVAFDVGPQTSLGGFYPVVVVVIVVGIIIGTEVAEVCTVDAAQVTGVNVFEVRGVGYALDGGEDDGRWVRVGEVSSGMLELVGCGGEVGQGLVRIGRVGVVV